MNAVTDAGTEVAETTPADTAAASGAPAPPVDASLLGSALAAIVLGGGLAAAGRGSALLLLVAVAIVQGVLALSWVFGTGMGGRWGALLVAGLAAGGADVTVSVWPHGRLGTMLAVLGLAVPVLFAHQLARGAARTAVVASLANAAVLVLGVVALPAYVQLRHEFGGPTLGGTVVAAAAGSVAAALLVAYLVDLVAPVPRFDPDVPRGMLALLAAAVVGGAVGYLLLHDRADFTGGRSAFAGAALGAVAELVAVGTAFLLRTSPAPLVRVGGVLRVVLAPLVPLALLAPGAFLLLLAIRA